MFSHHYLIDDYKCSELIQSVVEIYNTKTLRISIGSFTLSVYFSNIATLKIVLDDSSFVLNETDGAYTSNSSDDCEKVAREMKKDELKEKLVVFQF